MGKLVCFAALLVAAGCSLDAGDPPERDEGEAVLQALSEAVNFEGGTVIEGALPDTTAPDVSIAPLSETVIMAPDADSIMAIEVDNPDEGSDPVASTLIRFANARSYIEVQASSRKRPVDAEGDGDAGTGDAGDTSVATTVRIENPFTVAGDVCAGLCDKVFAVDVTEVSTLESGAVGESNTRTLALDCRTAGSASDCGENAGDEVAIGDDKEPGSSSGGIAPNPAGGTGGGAAGSAGNPTVMEPMGTMDAGTPPLVDPIPEELKLCGGVACQCADGVDNDGDGNIDGFDADCTAALDDSEADFGTAIAGDTMDPRQLDCHYDGNTGGGDDGCRYAVECGNGMLLQNDPSCIVSQQCVDSCRPLTPDGCDCFGCCSVFEAGAFTDVMANGGCASGNLGACASCVKSTGACENPCGQCELCMGRTIADLPPACGGIPTCDDAPPCTEQADCEGGLYCQQGCCIQTVLGP